MEFSPEIRLLDVLPKYFSKGAPLEKCTFEDLRNIATTVYQRFMTNRAAQDSSDHITWTSEKYGTKAYHEPPQMQQQDSVKPPIHFDGDRVLGNNINFMRTTFLYMEIAHATAEGDVGRVFEAIKVFYYDSLNINIISNLCRFFVSTSGVPDAPTMAMNYWSLLAALFMNSLMSYAPLS